LVSDLVDYLIYIDFIWLLVKIVSDDCKGEKSQFIKHITQMISDSTKQASDRAEFEEKV
jgi:hypothetical protein